jgi:small-conductance mechanosensitive channel
MEQLADIELWNRWGLTVNLLQLVQIGLVVAGLIFMRWAFFKKILPWYYNRETVTKQNYTRVKRVITLVLVSLFAVSVLRVLGIDYLLLDIPLQRSPTGDGAPVSFHIRISSIVTGLVAFVVAGAFDLVIGEFLIQRFHRAKGNESKALSEQQQEQVTRRFSAVRPIMYMLAIVVIAEETGIARYWFHREPDSFRIDPTALIDVEDVLFVILVLFLVRLGLVFITTFVLQSIYNRSKVDTGSQFAINRLIGYFVAVISILLVIQAAGFDLFVVWTGAAALLVGIGIGLQHTFNDLICGIIILFERSVKVGDVVELSGHQVGTIRKIGTRTSILETRDSIMVYVPNSKLIGENVTNWSQVDRTARFHIKVGVAYGSDTQLVKKALLQVAENNGKVLKSPKPSVRLLDFGDSALEMELLFWSRDLVRVEDTKSDLRFAIDSIFRKMEIEVPFPQRDVWIKSAPPSVPTREEE